MNKISHDSYVNCLEDQARNYLKILESIFGPCDPRFTFNTIKCSSDDNPCTYFPKGYHLNGDCLVDIHITKWPWENSCLDEGLWQIAHECVHLLDPGTFGTANVLEEGLATWFQNEPFYHIDLVKNYIATNQTDPSYKRAEMLVRRSMPDILRVVKRLRAKGIRI